MHLVYGAADLLVGRGGATTVAEVAVTGIPAILVPWAGAAEDHQTGNVRWLADAGAAVLLAETDVTRLGAEIEAHEVGMAVLEPLRELDEVAYLRFASVYQAWESLEDFEGAIALLRAEHEALGEEPTAPSRLDVQR